MAGVSAGTTDPSNGVSTGPRMVYPPDTHTDHDRPLTTTGHPDADLRTAVTPVDARAPDQDQILIGCGQCAKGYVLTADGLALDRCPVCYPNVIRFPSERVA